MSNPREVVFIFDSASTLPAHAAVKNVNGPWSNERMGLCGRDTGEVGPIPWIPHPDGGLCTQCAHLIEQVDGVWLVKSTLQPDASSQYISEVVIEEEALRELDRISALTKEELDRELKEAGFDEKKMDEIWQRISKKLGLASNDT
jgi:hypothetical protein